MHIKLNKEDNTLPLNGISTGDCFEYRGNIYMLVDDNQYVDLNTGHLYMIENDEEDAEDGIFCWLGTRVNYLPNAVVIVN